MSQMALKKKSTRQIGGVPLFESRNPAAEFGIPALSLPTLECENESTVPAKPKPVPAPARESPVDQNTYRSRIFAVSEIVPPCSFSSPPILANADVKGRVNFAGKKAFRHFGNRRGSTLHKALERSIECARPDNDAHGFRGNNHLGFPVLSTPVPAAQSLDSSPSKNKAQGMRIQDGHQTHEEPAPVIIGWMESPRERREEREVVVPEPALRRGIRVRVFDLTSIDFTQLHDYGRASASISRATLNAARSGQLVMESRQNGDPVEVSPVCLEYAIWSLVHLGNVKDAEWTGMEIDDDYNSVRRVDVDSRK
ncbi:hypothetical protein C8R44DRAFT_725170 [Mycena epipterygia]|nr:hypothetical protein C8R44DRAFT_725170 [Mycena epipterygia]